MALRRPSRTVLSCFNFPLVCNPSAQILKCCPSTLRLCSNFKFNLYNSFLLRVHEKQCPNSIDRCRCLTQSVNALSMHLHTLCASLKTFCFQRCVLLSAPTAACAGNRWRHRKACMHSFYSTTVKLMLSLSRSFSLSNTFTHTAYNSVVVGVISWALFCMLLLLQSFVFIS